MKKAGSLGIKRLMNKHRRVRTTVRCLLAIPLLRRDLMLRGFATVVNLANRLRILPALVLFFKYYIKTWLIGWRRKTLSVFKQTHRTNNATESANFMLRKLTGPHHPSLWRFLSKFCLHCQRSLRKSCVLIFSFFFLQAQSAILKTVRTRLCVRTREEGALDGCGKLLLS